jgi:multicomponent Na+:H+ antiporter subunit E
MLLWNILLALIWASLTGQFTIGGVFVGFVVGFLVLRLTRRDDEAMDYYRRVGRIILFVPLFLWELVRSNLRMARDVVLPQSRLQPGIIGVPLDARTDAEITCLANLITLTPGTLSLDVSDDRRTLYIHAMDARDPAAVRADIKHGLERRVVEVLR